MFKVTSLPHPSAVKYHNDLPSRGFIFIPSSEYFVKLHSRNLCLSVLNFFFLNYFINGFCTSIFRLSSLSACIIQVLTILLDSLISYIFPCFPFLYHFAPFLGEFLNFIFKLSIEFFISGYLYLFRRLLY